MSDILLLCWEFFKIGLFAIGGGMATIPFLAKVAQSHPEWYTLEMLADMVAVSESTPGPIGVNMATYAGFLVGEVLGAVLATLALVLPSFILASLVASGLSRYKENSHVLSAFNGIRPAVTGLIAAAFYAVFKIAVFPDGALNILSLALFFLVLLVSMLKKTQKLHVALYIALAALMGIALKL